MRFFALGTMPRGTALAEYTAAKNKERNITTVKCYATAKVEFLFGAPGGVIRQRMVNGAALEVEHARMRFLHGWSIIDICEHVGPLIYDHT